MPPCQAAWDVCKGTPGGWGLSAPSALKLVCQLERELRAQDARKVVGVWEAEFTRAPNAQKKLALLYLANDILQNSRKKGPEYVQEFFRCLPRPLQQLLKHGDAKARPRARLHPNPTPTSNHLL